MAQFSTQDTSAVVGALWPSGLPPYAKGDHNVSTVHEAGRLVPRHEEGLSAWCFVATDYDQPNRARSKYLAYLPVQNGRVQEVSVRFQGFVQKAYLGIYGNWDGTSDGAKDASQGVTLNGAHGEAKGVFNEQVEAATLLRRFVSKEVGGKWRDGHSKATTIEFSRQVFTKVSARDTAYTDPPSDPTNNLGEKAHELRREWKVEQGVLVGVQEQNTIRAAVPREIRVGDFVDVLATISIHHTRDWASTTRVTFKPLRIIRLATASVVRTVVPRPVTTSVTRASEKKDEGSSQLGRVQRGPKKVSASVDCAFD